MSFRHPDYLDRPGWVHLDNLKYPIGQEWIDKGYKPMFEVSASAGTCVICGATDSNCTSSQEGSDMPPQKRTTTRRTSTKPAGAEEKDNSMTEKDLEKQDQTGAETKEAPETEANPTGDVEEKSESKVGITSGGAEYVPAPPEIKEEKQPKIDLKKWEGAPREGVIVEEGDSAKAIPTQEVQGASNMVTVRENVWKASLPVNSRRPVYTLLVAAGSLIPKSDLDTMIG